MRIRTSFLFSEAPNDSRDSCGSIGRDVTSRQPAIAIDKEMVNAALLLFPKIKNCRAMVWFQTTLME